MEEKSESAALLQASLRQQATLALEFAGKSAAERWDALARP
jgi:hypothetical protein